MNFINQKERKAKILIVDDEAFNLMACKYILKAAGFQKVEQRVDTATNGQIALDMVKKDVQENKLSKYDLILMDQNMPVLNGCSATKSIREYLYHSLNPQPIIVGVSGQVEDEYVKKAVKYGMNQILSKPLDYKSIAVLLKVLNYI